MDAVRKIADAVLYEGYILWPYRRSAVKNQKRWTFGGVFPPLHASAHPDDVAAVRTECLLVDGDDVEVHVRFLHVVERRVLDSAGRDVDELVVGGERHSSWDEATEREAAPGAVEIPAGSEVETLGEGSLVRSWRELRGNIEKTIEPIRDGVFKVAVEIRNTTPWAGEERDDALRSSFCSAHVVLRARKGGFVSSTDPAGDLRAEAAACRNERLWPVLVGAPGARDTMLAAPIILPDYPEIAPESPGDLFDATEIDQLLILNVLALTDDEREEMRATDPRAREILDRCASLTPNELMRLHGAIRDFGPVSSR